MVLARLPCELVSTHLSMSVRQTRFHPITYPCSYIQLEQNKNSNFGAIPWVRMTGRDHGFGSIMSGGLVVASTETGKL